MLLLFVTAVILSTAVRPAVLWLEKRGIPKPLGILLIFALIGLLLGLLIWFSLPVLGQQSTAIAQNLTEGYQSLRHSLQRIPNIMVRRLLLVLPTDLTALTGVSISADVPLAAETEAALPAGEGAGNRLMLGLLQFVTVGILTFYWILEGEHLKQSAFLLVPLQKRESVREVVNEMEAKVSGYILGQGLLCLIIGVLAFAAYLLVGLPNALLLAVFAGLLEAVPTIGPFLGAVPAIMVALSISPMTALWVILATAVIQQLENSLLVPRVMNRTIGVRPLVTLVTLLALLAFGSLFGVLGALIALPLAAVIQLLLDRYLLTAENLNGKESGRDRLSVLRYETNQLVQDVRSQVRHKEGVPSAVTDELEDEVEAIALVFFLFFWLAGRLSIWMKAVVNQRGRSMNAATVLALVIRWGLIVLGVLVALSIALPSFKASDLIQILGISSVAIGFAFRDIFQNFLAGLIILLTDAFKIGDQIIVENQGLEGTVTDIQTRATTISTYDDRVILIPNGTLFTNAVTINTATERLRSEQVVEISYEAGIDTVCDLI